MLRGASSIQAGLLLLVGGCKFGLTALAPDAVDANGSGGDGWDGPACTSVGFDADATAWSLPDDYRPGALAWTQDLACDGASDLAHFLADMTGDGAPDLVITDDCQGGTVGTDHWLMHPGQDSTFGDAVQLALPDGFLPGTLAAPSNDVCVDAADAVYFVHDLDHDGLADLVVTDACDGSRVGLDQWALYPGTGTGFGAVETWTLPDTYTPGALGVSADPGCSDDDDVAFFIDNLDGDGLDDLVVTDGCSDGGVGSSRWNLHRNTGSGFDTAEIWDLPDGYGTDALATTGDDACGEADNLAYMLRDMDADGRADLVVTDDCQGGEVGSSHWRVHANTGESFDTATEWGLPGAYAAGLLNAGADGSCADTSDLAFYVDDLNGDRVADLIITDDCQVGATGTTHWTVHQGGAAGFGAAASWPLPTTFPDATFSTASNEGCQGPTDTSYFVDDIDGDGLDDLVVPDDCQGGGAEALEWLVHSGVCADG